jgi:predicted CoA-binding protein
MSFTNPSREDIDRLLAESRNIAVVGLSDNPARTSYGVSAAMQSWGYRILPVNPAIREALGEQAIGSLAEAVASLPSGQGIDLVNVFRRPEHVAEVVNECIALGLPAIWLQEGVVDEAAAVRARDAGITVVMDRCIMKDRARMGTLPR